MSREDKEFKCPNCVVVTAHKHLTTGDWLCRVCGKINVNHCTDEYREHLRKNEPTSLHDLPEEDQRKIITKMTERASAEQREVMKRAKAKRLLEEEEVQVKAGSVLHEAKLYTKDNFGVECFVSELGMKERFNICQKLLKAMKGGSIEKLTASVILRWVVGVPFWRVRKSLVKHFRK